MKNVYFLIIGLILFQNVRGQTVTAQSWFSYGNTNMGGYSWTNAALTTNSIEIVNNNGTVSNSSPTLAFHRYGTGGPQFTLAADGSNVLFLESSGQNSARSPNAYGGGPNSYFSRLHIDGGLSTTGNVGIGTTIPNGNLEVNGKFVVGGTVGNIDPNPSFQGGNLSFLAGTGKMIIGWNRTAGQGETDFISNKGSGGLGGFAFYNHDDNNAENQLMWILASGQVIIGNAQGKQGNYKLAVAGSAVAESVTVKLVSNWPDYVFKPSYHLPSLREVKTYIDQNHCLPEVPSEKEILENGLNLGEMNKVLIKKVEELTLYLIEKDKKDQQQQDQINLLNHKLKTLSLKVQRKL